MRKLAGIAFFAYCGLAFWFVIAYAVGSVSVALACAAVTRLARRS